MIMKYNQITNKKMQSTSIINIFLKKHELGIYKIVANKMLISISAAAIIGPITPNPGVK